MRILFQLILLLIPLAVAGAQAPEYDTYGAAPRLTSQPLSLSQAIEPPNHGRQIRVEGLVTSVCQNKGCWLMLTEKGLGVRTTFKDYGFFVPKDIAGRKVIVEGILSETTITQAEARHFAEDGGKSKEEIEQIVGDQKGYTFVADSVLIPKIR